MARKRRDDDDEVNDDIPARVGRPRSPEEFGPPKPELHQREEYVARLQAILDALENSRSRPRRAPIFATHPLPHGSAARHRSPAFQNPRGRSGDHAAARDRRNNERHRGVDVPNHEGSRVVPATNEKFSLAGSFTADTAAKTGRTQRSVQMEAKRGEDIGAADLSKVVGTLISNPGTSLVSCGWSKRWSPSPERLAWPRR